MSGTNESDDEKLARQLQEEWNKGITMALDLAKNQAMDQDMLLAQKLMEEEQLAQKGSSKETTSKEGSGPQDLKDIQKLQQDELDHLFALSLQENLYTEADHKPKPIPAPVPMPYVHHPQFVRQKRDPGALPPTPEAIKRITSDLKEVLHSKNRFLYVSPDEEDITHIQALIIGPPDTPYAYGFFHFDMIYPHDYPWRPPKVQIITTDSGQTRFNPNLYSNGKVCLSILGTWSGPGWTQIQTMLSTLLSIQSLMNPNPYHNEPGFEVERKPGDVEKYNQCITHETLRVAVCGMLENPTCGELFRDEIEELFLENYQHYETLCTNLQIMDGKPMLDPFGEQRGNFQYAALLKRLKTIKEQIENKKLQPIEEYAPPTTTATTAQSSENAMDVDKKPESIAVQTTEKEPQPMETEAQHTPVTATQMDTEKSKDPTPVTAELDADAELARKLQEEEYGTSKSTKYSPNWSTYSTNNYNSYGYNDYQQAYTPSGSYTPVKAPSLAELAKETPKEASSEDSEIKCLVCHQSPKEYIVLPNCQSPHVYCMPCAGKMVNAKPQQDQYGYYPGKRHNANKRGNGSSIQCVLCSVVSYFDPTSGLASLKRKRRKRAEERNGRCPEHGEDYCFYCIEDSELLCFVCASVSSHARHNLEAFDVAQKQVESKLKSQLGSLEGKRAKLETFVDSVKKQQDTLTVSTEAAAKDAKDKIAALRKMLDDKEKELDESVKRIELSKKHTIDTELKKAQERMNKIDESITMVSEAMGMKTPLEFLLKTEEAEETIRHTVLAADPEVKPRWFEMPQLYTQHLEQHVKNLKFVDKRHGFHPLGMPMPYEEEDDDGTYEEEF